MIKSQQNKIRFEWVDALKAFAILGILLNHFVEEFGAGPWFSNPSYNWPELSYRLSHILPDGQNPLSVGIRFLGWLGDMGPGVFILLSGFTLTWSQLRNKKTFQAFYSSRLLRILPLYITIHLIILGFALIVNQPANLNPFSPRVLLSLLGLRFADSLFFFINPSWWFIWLILQLYLFFPLLFKLLKKTSLPYFILITSGITLLSRLAGLLDLTYSGNLYYWMTGLFFGTRLFEFALGMLLAKVIFSSGNNLKPLTSYNTLKIASVSLVIYIAGFVLSWFYFGSLFSNILITIGLSGVFYGIFKAMGHFSALKRLFLFIGKNSFSVFLIHQPFMMFWGGHLDGANKIIALMVIIVLSFPTGYIIEKSVNFFIKAITENFPKIAPYFTGKVAWHILLAYSILIISIHAVSLIIYRDIVFYIHMITLLYLLVLLIFISASYIQFKKIKHPLAIVLFITCSVFYIIFPSEWTALVSLPLTISVVLSIFLKPIPKNYLNVLLNLIFSGALLFFFEYYFRKAKPLETPIWSEYPALQTDSASIYSLIPDKKTHLKYNNYDYVLRTNKMGFACPDIDLSLKDSSVFRIYIVGDAFSMPEGMEYEDSFPGLLDKKLKESVKNKTVQVINGGVTGYGPNEMLGQIKKYVDTIKPDLIINEFFVNEFQEINYSPERRLANIGFTRQESKRTEFWGYNQTIKYFEKLLRKLTHRPDHLHNYNKALLNLYVKGAPYYSDTVVNKIDNYLTKVKTICDRSDIDFWLMYVPGQIEVSSPEHIDFYPENKNIYDTTIFDLNTSHQIINSLCKKHNINLLDTKDILKKHKEQPVYFPASWHWNKTGHLLIANTLAEKIETQLN